MATAKIAISIDPKLLVQLDRLVAAGVFPNRSNAVQQALEQKLERIGRTRLALECTKLDMNDERTFSEMGIELEAAQWPEY